MINLNLSKEQQTVFDNVVEGLKTTPTLASNYSNKKCKQCTGKGYYDMDHILKANLSCLIDGKPSRVTPSERALCPCIRKNIIKEIKELEFEQQLA